MTAAVDASQRYTRARRCPICAGAELDPRGQGIRCIGYVSSDGTFARCSRAEHAGPLQIEDSTGTYVHRLSGPCDCGEQHGEQPWESGGKGSIVAAYDYADETGAVLSRVNRRITSNGEKTFSQCRPDGRGGWIGGTAGVRQVPFKLAELIAADPTKLVFVVEGEKCAIALHKLGLIATTARGGTGGVKQWESPEFCTPLRGRHVVVLPDVDADGKGRRYAERVAAALAGVTASVKIVELPGLQPVGEDVIEWLERGGTPEKLLDLVKASAKTAAVPKGPCRTAMSTITARPVTWLWTGRLQTGEVVSIEGYPASGKSTLASEIVACVTSGKPLYGDRPMSPRSALWIGHEENLATALRPRLDAAGAAAERVFVYVNPPMFPQNYDWLENEIRETDAGIVVIDPIDAYLDFGANGDSHRNGDVRARLLGLAVVAERTGATVVMIRHFKKASGGSHAVYRSAGSLAYSAVARAIIAVVQDPEDDELRLATWSKVNDGPKPSSLAWRIGPGRSVAWIGEDGRDAQSLMDQADDRSQKNGGSGAIDRACEFLRQELADGRVASAELQRRATAAGHSERTLKRARQNLGVLAAPDGRTRVWYTELPGKGATVPLSEKVGPLGTLGPLRVEQEGQQGQGGHEISLERDGPLAHTGGPADLGDLEVLP